MLTASTLDKKLSHKVLLEIGICASGSVFLALMSQFAIPLPFTPVLLTLQTFALFLLAGCLGSKRAVLSVVGFLIQGSFGLPVFSGGVASLLWWKGTHAGYLFGFVVAAFLMGKILEKQKNGNFSFYLLVFLLGDALILCSGAAWLSLLFGPRQAFTLGVLPFLIVDALKIVSAAALLKGYRLFREYFSQSS